MNYGLAFKRIKSQKFGIVMQSDNRQLLPDSVRLTQQVVGVPGTVDFGNDTPNEKVIIVIFTYNYRNDPALLQSQMEQISGWLYDDGNYYDLIFDDAPQRKYSAKVTGKVDLSQGNSKGVFQVEFTCNPPYPFDLSNNPITPASVQQHLLWDTAILDPAGVQYMKNFTADGTMQFTVGGAVPVSPKIKLIGYIPLGLTLTYGTQKWVYISSLQYDGIVIDCNMQTVTRMSDGINLFPHVDSANDAFFILQPGQQSISVSGVGGVYPQDLTVTLEFLPMEA